MLVRRLGVVFATALLMMLLGCGSSPTSSACEGLAAEQCGQPDAGVPDGGAPLESELVVDTDWLEARLGDPDIQLIDTRLNRVTKIRGFLARSSLRPVSNWQRPSGAFRRKSMPPMQGQPVLRAAGLRNEVTAVVYGEAPEYDPSRIVWVLRYYGHDDVRYLDGGFAAWVAAQGALDTDPPITESTEYTIVERQRRAAGYRGLGALSSSATSHTTCPRFSSSMRARKVNTTPATFQQPAA